MMTIRPMLVATHALHIVKILLLLLLLVAKFESPKDHL